MTQIRRGTNLFHEPRLLSNGTRRGEQRADSGQLRFLVPSDQRGREKIVDR